MAMVHVGDIFYVYVCIEVGSDTYVSVDSSGSVGKTRCRALVYIEDISAYANARSIPERITMRD